MNEIKLVSIVSTIINAPISYRNKKIFIKKVIAAKKLVVTINQLLISVENSSKSQIDTLRMKNYN